MQLVLCVGAAILMYVYLEYRMWYVPTDIIGFARILRMDMAVASVSRANVNDYWNYLK